MLAYNLHVTGPPITAVKSRVFDHDATPFLCCYLVGGWSFMDDPLLSAPPYAVCPL